MRLEFKIIIPKSIQHIIFVGEVFQIEISDGLVHPLGSRQNVSLCPAMVINGREFLGVCLRLEFKRIIPMIVQNIMYVGEVFQIEVSDGLVHPVGSHQNVNLYPAVVITGARVFRSLYAFRVKRIK